jgi:hypothetical protein
MGPDNWEKRESAVWSIASEKEADLLEEAFIHYIAEQLRYHGRDHGN